ncbi:MAG: double-strand break repair helicase AddA [Pseudomonadota bacterium]
MSNLLKIPEHVLREQYASSDPNVSAWVAANAGSGKTHVLTQRVIRLMLAGNAPDRILCLTFTKAAAANMKTRVFDTLAKWTMMEDGALDEAIRKTSGFSQRIDSELRNRARCLFTQALDTPGGLKIQTIHAFCESLLHQFPLEANVPGHFETLQELGQATLLQEAKAYVLAGHGNSKDIASHFQALTEAVSQDAIERGIAAIVSNRNAFLDWIEVGIEKALEPLSEVLGVKASDTPESIQEACLKTLPVSDEALRSIAVIAGESDKPTDHFVDAQLSIILSKSAVQKRFSALENLCLTQKGELRSESRLVTAFVKNQLPDAVHMLRSCGETLLAARDTINAAMLVKNSRHLFHIADAVLDRYAGLKRAKGLIDFDDQVEKCASLLNRTEIRDWIRYRLDRGIDHVLVDEAQDTSLKQWEIINAITADFHTGETAAARNRTVFVVGDEKQSIYSFQGARPAEFAHQQKGLEKTVTSVQKEFHPGKLALSFRSTSDVLHAVDLVFEKEQNRRGLMQSGEAPAHDAVRTNDAGEVQIWPLFVKEKTQDQESWLDPVDRTAQSDPAIQLAERIAASISDWVGRPLPGSDQPLRYEDILVLVRKRDRFIIALTRTMKDKGLSVAGADRLTLTDHIAVEDLLAVGQFVLLPSDDLNLACVLKGVLFGISEEALFDFAHSRGKTCLFDAVQTAAELETHPRHALAKRIVPKLQDLIRSGERMDVFEFFAWVLGPFGMRKAFLSRLGMEAEDVMDAFLDETIAFAREGGIGLQSFISTLKRAEPEIKREVELDRDEVRILTVHASKGLEAKVVFLVDPCNAPWTEKHRPPILPMGSGYLWLPSSDHHIEATRDSSEQIRLAAEEEYRRLLYVGMTRAADRLIVCGFRGVNEPKHEYWHQMVHDALEDSSEQMLNADDEVTGFRWCENKAPETSHHNVKTEVQAVPEDNAAPDWLLQMVPHEKPLPQPLSPSGAFLLIDKDNLEQQSVRHSKTGNQNPSFAIQKGRAVHQLLEVLPDFTAEERSLIGERYLQKIGSDWTEEQQAQVWSDIHSILANPEYAQLFSGKSLAEVSLTGKLETQTGERLIAGQIDRLVVSEQTVAIIDYKTNFVVPREIPGQILTQLSLYRELVRQIYPEHEVTCHILWVHAPAFIEVPGHLLNNALENIKKI